MQTYSCSNGNIVTLAISQEHKVLPQVSPVFVYPPT